MNFFELVEITTPDKIIHQGLFMPSAKPSKRALLWIHGLSSTFYSNVPLMNEFAKSSRAQNMGFASFNNRGHDLLASLKRLDKRKPSGYRRINGGAGYEIFKQSVLDIDAGIHFLVQKGFSEIILVGHSTGALKACYYGGRSKNKYVQGIVLAGFVSDRLAPSVSSRQVAENLKKMQRLIDQGRGNELLLNTFFFPLTPRRYKSLFYPGTLEDQASYGDTKPTLTHFKRIKRPLLVVLGEQDEYLDRPARMVLDTLDAHNHSTNYKSVIIQNASHSFTDNETETVKTIFDWIKTI